MIMNVVPLLVVCVILAFVSSIYSYNLQVTNYKLQLPPVTIDAKIIVSVINFSLENVMRFLGMINISNNLRFVVGY